MYVFHDLFLNHALMYPLYQLGYKNNGNAYQSSINHNIALYDFGQLLHLIKHTEQRYPMFFFF